MSNTSRLLPLLTASFAAALSLAPASAHAGATIWQLGAADALDSTPAQGSDEFVVTGWDPVATYDIDTLGSATSNVALPGYLWDNPSCSACAEKIKITFDVPAEGYAADELELVYARFGSETDVIRIDGDYLGRVAVSEGGLAEFKVSLPKLDPGQHHITIKYAGKRPGTGTGNGHHIDYIKLVESGSGGYGDSWTELWGLGVEDGGPATPMDGSSEFGYTSTQWDPSYIFDVSTDTEAAFPAALSNDSTQYSDMPGAVDIDFELSALHERGELVFKYARYGSEVDLLMVDNTTIGEIGAAEGEWIVARYVLPELTADPHDLSITILDGLGVSGAHFIDQLRLSSSL